MSQKIGGSPRNEYVIKYDILNKMETERKIIYKIRKRKLKSLGDTMRKKGLEYLTPTGQ